MITQYLARKIVLALRDSERLDIVHQPIPVSPRFPSPMFGLKLPVIIGPMNGGMKYPPAFQHLDSIFRRILVPIGHRFSDLVNSVLPGKKLAKVLLVANRRTRPALPRGIKGQVIELAENGVDLSNWLPPEEMPGSTPRDMYPPRFVFIGRLIDLKRVDVAIEALCQVPDAHLEVIGDGSMREAWENLNNYPFHPCLA